MARPKDHAPPGYTTVREAAQILGVSEQAIRARMGRGTLPERVEHLESGETRRYVLREALNGVKGNGNGPATKDDAAEISLANAIHAEEIVRGLTDEMNRRADIAEGQRRASVEKIQAIQSVTAHIDRAIVDTLEETKVQTELLTEILKREMARPTDYKGWRIIAGVIVACAIMAVLLLILIAFEILPFLPSISHHISL